MRTFDVDSFVGHKFGKLTIVRYIENKEIGNHGKTLAMYECECECGNHIIVPLQYLKSGNVTMCKDCKEKAYESKWIGRRFGTLTVISIVQKAYYDDSGKFHNAKMRCKCDCGNIIDVYTGNLKNKKTCGVHCGMRADKSHKLDIVEV